MLKMFQTSPYATFPKFSTQQSACFDISACLKGNSIQIFGKESVRWSNEEIYLYSGDRVAVPTGLILDIFEGDSYRIAKGDSQK